MSKSIKTRYFTASGSNSLDIILNIEGVTEKIVIWLPYLICRDVLDVVHKYTRKTRFYLTDKRFNPIGLDEVFDNQIIILVNYFGFPQNSELIEQLKLKCLVIEDNSHGLFSKSADGKILGTRGVYGLVSLWKTLFVPNGGILYSSRLAYGRVGWIIHFRFISLPSWLFGFCHWFRKQIYSDYIEGFTKLKRCRKGGK